MQSLTRLPARHQRELASFVERLRAGLGDNLHCLAIYGSAVRGAFDARHSDLNVLVVLEASTVEAQGVVGDAIAASRVDISPFVVDRALLPRATRAFAVKFASIARAHRVLAGIDVLAGLEVDAGIARFLVEQALLNARLRAIQAFIRARRSGARHAAFVAALVPQLVTEMSELLRLEGELLPDDWDARVPMLARGYGIAEPVLQQLLQWRTAPSGSAAREVLATHRTLLAVLDAAVNRCIASNLRHAAQSGEHATPVTGSMAGLVGGEVDGETAVGAAPEALP